MYMIVITKALLVQYLKYRYYKCKAAIHVYIIYIYTRRDLFHSTTVYVQVSKCVACYKLHALRV